MRAIWGRVLLVGGLYWPCLAPAQETTAADASLPVEPLRAEAEEAAEDRRSVQLEEVVVTARRKEERAQDVPISLAVLDGESMGRAGLTLATDIQERVPGLVVSVPNARLTSYTIRGLGSSSANDGIESSVGLFLDGVYLGRQGLSLFDLVDLDRVEILRGPQGTLFGKNTTAGAINIVTRLPSDTQESTLEGTVGNFGTRLLRGSASGPLDEEGEWAARLTGYLSQRDGMIHNIFDGENLNARNREGLRGQLLWTPAGNFSARFIAEFGNTDEVCCAYPLIGPVRRAVSARDEFMEYQRPSLNVQDRITDSDKPTSSKMLQRAYSAELTLDLGDDHRLTSITAYRNWFFVPLNDDATSLHLATPSTLNRQVQVSQEIRLDSSFGRHDSVVGFYYLRQDFQGREVVQLGDDIVGWVFGGLIRQNVLPFATESNTGPALYAVIPPRSLDGTVIDTRYSQTSDSVGSFASINWHLTEAVDLTTGLRYTHEWKDAHVGRTRSGGDPDAVALSAADPFLLILDEALGTDVYSLGFGGLLDSVAGGPFQRSNERAEGNFSGQIALSIKLGPELLGYVSGARGYKGGGINLGVTGENIKPTFEPEEATSIETGIKGRFFDRRVSASLAVYNTEVRDYQALTFDDEQTLLPNPRQTNLLNVGKVRLRGAELEGYGYAAAGLMLRAGVAYSDAVTTDFKTAPNEDRALAIGGVSTGSGALFRDLSGETLYNAPRWSGTAGAEYTWFLQSGREVFGGLDYSFRTGYWGTVEHGRASYIEGYSLTNARLGLRASSRVWEGSLWARNIFDTEYTATVYPLYGVGDYGAFAGDPLTVGFTVRGNF